MNWLDVVALAEAAGCRLSYKLLPGPAQVSTYDTQCTVTLSDSDYAYIETRDTWWVAAASTGLAMLEKRNKRRKQG